MLQVALSDWNPDVGLYRKREPGHTEPVSRASVVHSFPETFLRFAIDAQLGRLDPSRLEQSLRALIPTQVSLPGERLDGCLRWYLEEPRPVDSNASFFIGLTLLVLELGYAPQVGETNRELMGSVFKGLNRWFDRELEERSLHYPNKALGDLVCAWLLAEYFGEEADLKKLETRIDKAIGYWKESHWGWGEHLSQVYSTVMLTEISSLVLLQKHLPARIEAALLQLADELLNLQDTFAEGPWTPTIRCYAFDEVPSEATFRQQVRQWDAEQDADFLHTLPDRRFMLVCFATLFWERGWHDRFPARRAAADGELAIPCSEGVMSHTYIEGPLRLGSLSRFPLRSEWDTPRWGLSWQSFPVAAACVGRLWAFPQWRVHWQDGSLRCHPAHRKCDGYLRNALVPDEPSFTGRTEACHNGLSCEIVRTLPAWHAIWQSAFDAWTIICGEEISTVEYQNGPHACLEVSGNDFVLTLKCRLASVHPRKPVLVRNESAPQLRWELALRPEDAGSPIEWSVRLQARGQG